LRPTDALFSTAKISHVSLFRSILFWLHLAAGVICGLVIALLCFTGTVLAFEKELIAWAERDARRIASPAATATRLGVDELAGRLRATFPAAKPASIVVARDPHAAVAFPVSRTKSYHANPYTGEVRRSAATSMGGFMQQMFELHRYLGFSGEKSRPNGKLVTGIANLTFCFLALSGLVLWWPRSLSWRAFRPGIWFTQNASARARDWNWHNTIGFWCAPVLIGLTLTALPISFRWAAALTYTLAGTPLPATGPQSSGAPPPAANVPAPAAGARAVSREALLAAVQRELPAWQSITFRLAHQPDPAKPQAVSFTVREAGTWPRTATTTLQFDPFSGALLQRDGHAELSAARKLRAWSRFLHTGEALGPWGQLVAGLACLGGCFLVYTGFALSWRRFFRKPEPATDKP
jgi:uncharacterized iron-regulated membrane protein